MFFFYSSNYQGEIHRYALFFAEYKENFLKTGENLVLIGGPDDGVITPWESRYIIFHHYEIQKHNANLIIIMPAAILGSMTRT